MNTERKVGLFFLAALIVIAFLIMKTGQFQFFQKGAVYTLRATMDSATGLDKDSDIRLAGVKIGKVLGVSLKDGKAVVTMEIHKEVQLPEGSRVKVVAKGILGDKYLEILPGNRTGRVKSGEMLESEKAVSMDDIMDIVYSVAKDIKKITTSLSKTVGTNKGEEQIANILENIDRITSDLREITARNKDNFTTSIDNIKSFTGDLKKDIPSLAAKLDKLSNHLNEIVTENRQNLKDTLANAKEGTKKLNDALDYIDSIAKKIDTGEGTIGQLVNDKETGDNLNKTLVSFRRAMDSASDYLGAFSKTGVYLGFKSEYMFDISDSKSYFSVDIVPSATRLYQLEIIDSPYGKVRENSYHHVITDPSGNIINDYTETITATRDAMKFTALIGQRYKDFNFKVGLIESKGGFALDYDPHNYRRWKFFGELSDFSRENNLSPRLKIGASYRIYGNFFLDAGGDDILVSENSQIFAGVGIRFRDDFFKHLISSMSFK
ncbi:MAG: MCE family protein [Acidobacteria bacterium]|nr:MCE family protein [Acidobacteriota bacterium]